MSLHNEEIETELRVLYIGPAASCENFLLAIPDCMRHYYFIEPQDNVYAVKTALPEEYRYCSCIDYMSMSCDVHPDEIPF